MEETELFLAYKEAPDEKTREKLRGEITEKYLYIANVLARKFVGRGVEYDDLVQIASMALVKGIDRFDPSLGVKFATFITPTITGEIKNYFRDYSRLVKYPRKLSQLAAEIRKCNEETLAKTGKKPTVAELSALLGVEEESIVKAMEIGTPVSLDQQIVNGEEETPLYNVIPDKVDYFETFEQNDSLRSAMVGLSEIEKKFIRYRYGKELSQSDIAAKLGVSQMYVSRMEKRVLEKLREKLKG